MEEDLSVKKSCMKNPDGYTADRGLYDHVKSAHLGNEDKLRHRNGSKGWDIGSRIMEYRKSIPKVNAMPLVDDGFQFNEPGNYT